MSLESENPSFLAISEISIFCFFFVFLSKPNTVMRVSDLHFEGEGGVGEMGMGMGMGGNRISETEIAMLS